MAAAEKCKKKKNFLKMSSLCLTSSGSNALVHLRRGHQGCWPPSKSPNSFNSVQFLEKNGKIIAFHIHLRSWCPTSGKSWIHLCKGVWGQPPSRPPKCNIFFMLFFAKILDSPLWAVEHPAGTSIISDICDLSKISDIVFTVFYKVRTKRTCFGLAPNIMD